MSLIIGTISNANYVLAMDATGHGFQYDSELIIKTAFHYAPNTVPVTSDDSGNYCVFLNADGSYTLSQRGKVVFSANNQAIIVSPGGQHFVVSSEGNIQLFTEQQIEHLFGKD